LRVVLLTGRTWCFATDEAQSARTAGHVGKCGEDGGWDGPDEFATNMDFNLAGIACAR
jgi:hypothetical protein